MGGFYKLQNGEVATLMETLSLAETVVYLHLNSRIPFGGERDFSARHLAKELGISHVTVSKAIKRLDALGHIDYKIGVITIRRGKAQAPRINTAVTAQMTEQSWTANDQHWTTNDQLPLSTGQQMTSTGQQMTSAGQQMTSQAPKPLLSAGSESPRSNIENIDQSSSRSIAAIAPLEDDDDEDLIFEDGALREGFRNWLKGRAATLPTFPTYLDAWVLSEAQKPENQERYLELHRGSGRGLIPVTAPHGGPALETFPAVPPNTSKLPPNNEDPMLPRPNLRVMPGGQAPAIAPEEHLARLTTKWRIQVSLLQRSQICQQVAANPDWGIICTMEAGPQLAPQQTDEEEVAF
jgi:hypothetical protein